MSGPGPAGDQAVVREFIARLDGTLAASSARVELRSGFDDLIPPSHLLPPEDHDPGRVEQLVTSAARLAWNHAVPDKWRVWWREMEASLITAGFAEPAAGRYQVSNGKSATVCTGGQHYTGSPGQPLHEGRQDDAAPQYRDPLAWLRLLRGVTEARYAGEETLRGTPCRKVILSKVLREMRPASAVSQEDEKEDNPAEFTVWIDEHHVRQLETDIFFSRNRSLGTEILELWDFGVPVDSLDWTRFPGRPGQALPEDEGSPRSTSRRLR
jgi:hypothetical protein